MPSDSELIQQFVAGDNEALGAMVRRYQDRAGAHALMLIGNHEDARDAVQEAFMDVANGLKGFDRQRDFYPWFYVLLRNRCYKLLRSRGRSDQAMKELGERLQLLKPTNAMKEDAEWLQECLLRLSVEDRELLTLRHFDGLTYSELAERLEIPQGTVMSRLFHARRRLRESLQRQAADQQRRFPS